VIIHLGSLALCAQQSLCDKGVIGDISVTCPTTWFPHTEQQQRGWVRNYVQRDRKRSSSCGAVQHRKMCFPARCARVI
jgi:hypothetical protein